MSKLVYSGLSTIFGASLTSDVTTFMQWIIDALAVFFTDSNMSGILAIFVGIAGSLMTIYLFVDIINNVSKDMITLERLILIFIKYFIALLILMYLKEIMMTFFNLTNAIYKLVGDPNTLNGVESGNSSNITYFGHDVWPTDYEMVKDDIEAAYGKSVKAILTHFATMVVMLLLVIIGFGARCVAFLMATSNAIMLIARTLFAPMGIVQLFDEGQRSAGMRYLKNFIAEGLTFAVIVGVMFAATQLQHSIIGSVLADYSGGINRDNLVDIVSNNLVLVSSIVIQVSALGGIMKSNQLAKDIVGV